MIVSVSVHTSEHVQLSPSQMFRPCYGCYLWFHRCWSDTQWILSWTLCSRSQDNMVMYKYKYMYCYKTAMFFFVPWSSTTGSRFLYVFILTLLWTSLSRGPEDNISTITHRIVWNWQKRGIFAFSTACFSVDNLKNKKQTNLYPYRRPAMASKSAFWNSSTFSPHNPPPPHLVKQFTWVGWCQITSPKRDAVCAYALLCAHWYTHQKGETGNDFPELILTNLGGRYPDPTKNLEKWLQWLHTNTCTPRKKLIVNCIFIPIRFRSSLYTSVNYHVIQSLYKQSVLGEMASLKRILLIAT